MARITFFIGNGFDINVGLDTRYKDFYKYYIAENPEEIEKKIMPYLVEILHKATEMERVKTNN